MYSLKFMFFDNNNDIINSTLSKKSIWNERYTIT